ncbi:MAG: hypothetical protein JWM33_2743, partial [Caulobacteraceae bacterium]|nr:hypothetical protein [Caulobacteraceae bacterium]
VEDQIRYVALAMGEGGLNPAAADLTWSRRFGDCKGKTVVLLALLRELGIEAQPALVRAEGADGLDQLLPAVSPFDHVMVRAVVDNHVYWLDGTRQGDGALAALPVPDMDWALPLSVAGTGLERLVLPLPTEAQEAQVLTIDLSGGKSDKLPAKLDYVLRGESALGVRLALAQMDPSLAEAAIKGALKEQASLDFTKAGMTDQDGVVTLHGEGTVDASWYTDGVSRRPAVALGGDAYAYFDLPDRSLGATPDAPMALNYPNFQSARIVIILPGDGAGFNTSGADSDITAGGVRITRTTRTDGHTVTIDQTTRTLQTEVALAEVKTAIARFDAAPTDKAVVLLAPRDFAVTAAQLAATVAADPTNATALVELGVKAADQGRYAEAIRQYDAAIKAQPSLARAWRTKAWAEMRLSQYDAALADADKAILLDPQEPYGPYYRGLIHAAKGDYAKAVDDYAAALKLNPTLTEVLVDRVAALIRLKRYDAAQADIDAGLKLDRDNDQLRASDVDVILSGRPPGPPAPGALTAAIKKAYAGVTSYDALVGRGTLLAATNDAADDGLADLAAAIRIDPDRPEAYRVRGQYYMRHDKAADGVRDLDKMIALAPTLSSYLASGQARMNAKDYAGARANFVAAAAKYPDSVDPALRLASLAQNQGDFAAALAQIDKIIVDHPDLPAAYTQQAQLYIGQKNYVEAAHSYERLWALQPTNLDLAINASSLYEAAQDYPQALAVMDKAVALSPTTAVMLNDRCYLKAKREIQLSTALADCDQALKLEPDRAGYLDSRGLVYLRLGQWDKAIADYDAALKLQQVLPDSAYGRAIAKARKGDKAGSEADIADATRAAPDIAKTFADLGLKP